MPVSISSQVINYFMKALVYRDHMARAQEVNEAQWGFEQCASSFQNLPTILSLHMVSRGHFITPFESN